MFKLPKWAHILVETVGGWWSLMSGAVSIPFAFLALLVGPGNDRKLFALLAFCALWVLIIRMGFRNYELIEGQKLKDQKFEAEIESIKKAKAQSVEEIQSKQAMKRDFTFQLGTLEGRRRDISNIDEVNFEDLEFNIHQCTKSYIELAGLCIKEHLGDEEMKIFLNDAGFPTPESVAYNSQRWQMMVVEQYEMRLKELIRKHT